MVAKSKSLKNAKPDLVVGACRSAYVTLVGVFGSLFFASLFAMVTVRYSFWQFAVVWLLVSLGIFVWLCSFKVSMTETEVVVSIFARTNSLKWFDIEEADVRIGYKSKDGFGDSFKPPFRLVLLPRDSAGKQQISINLKLLSREDIAQVIERLESRLGTVQHRDRLIRMISK